jgi:catechol 2,3-dioxygenase-like lactoylglutathione lyase family enzyme
VRPNALDHVALWVAGRGVIADFATRHLGMHVIERSDAFTLVGVDARRFKLTLFAAAGPRERGALKHVALRVRNLDAALSRLGTPSLERAGPEEAYLDVSEGLRLGLVEAETDVDFDLDHVALFSAAPLETAREYARLGFAPASPGRSGNPRVEVNGGYVEFHPGEPGDPARPLLNHLAVLVDSAEEHRSEAERSGIEVADFVDAPNTLAVFVWGPERVKIEYVEHKPSFSLA